MAEGAFPKKKMKPENAAALQDLKEQIEKSKNEEVDSRLYEWFHGAVNINFWEYYNVNWNIIKEFVVMEDLTNWDDLASKLGLPGIYIEHCHKYNDQYPTKEVFRALRDMENCIHLSLWEVLDALRNLGHHHILQTVAWQEGLEKMKDIKKPCSLQEVCKPQQNNEKDEFDPDTFSINIHRQLEVLVQADNKGSVPSTITQPSEPSKPSQPCQDVTVMMIFAQDAKDNAQEAARQLNNPESERGRVRVLQVTGDTPSAVATQLRKDPYTSIHKWFRQVNFIVPVLSPQFLSQTQNRDLEDTESSDQIYNRFVYRLMLDQYVNNGCRNTRCRALCPDLHRSQVMKNKLVRGNGLLQMYWNCSVPQKVEEFANILISEH